MKEHYNNEEINLLSKIKEDNKKNIENIKKFYETKLLNLTNNNNNNNNNIIINENLNYNNEND